LPKLLDSLCGQQGVNLEIIVVDRQSRDDSLQILNRYPDVRVLNEPPESGLVSGYHRGFLGSSGDLLFFCNEDMWFEPDCISRLAARIDLEQRIGIVDPWQWTYDGLTLLHAGVRFRPSSWDMISPYPNRTVEFLHQLSPGDIIPIPCAGAVLIHRKVYVELGGWDTSFFLNDEDTDLALRAWLNGWRCVTEPQARVYHAVGASNSQTIPSLSQSVGQRRYVSTLANKAIIAYKYFSVPLQCVILIFWALRLINNLFKGRWKFVQWDCLVWKEIQSRKAAAVQFREQAKMKFPGENFFLVPEFQAQSLESAGGKIQKTV